MRIRPALFAIVMMCVVPIAALHAQRVEIRKGLRVHNDGQSGYPTIVLEGSSSRGGSLILMNNTTSQTLNAEFGYMEGAIGITNGVPGTPFDMFIHADYPSQDRWLKVVNVGPGTDLEETSSFGLMLDGPIELLPVNDSQVPWAGLYSQYADGDLNPVTPDEQYVFVNDGKGNATILSSHMSPSAKSGQSAAQSSFADPSISLPYSFTHENAVIGKGQVIDMAKLVAYVESQMIADQGPAAGKIIYEYDLPESKRQSPEEYRAASRKHYLETISERAKWRKVQLGNDGGIPPEAFITTEATRRVERKVTVERKQIDFTTERIVTVSEQRTVFENEPTGRQVKMLDPSYRFVGGELYHSAELGNLDAALDNNANFDPPQWVLMRVRPDGIVPAGRR